MGNRRLTSVGGVIVSALVCLGPARASATDHTLGGALPHMADFLTNPDWRGFGGTTFYTRAPAAVRQKCREGLKRRGYTHMYTSVASERVGDSYSENPAAFRALLQELVEDGIITCPHHGFRYDLGSGECLTAPEVQLQSHAVRVIGSRVEVRLAK